MSLWRTPEGYPACESISVRRIRLSFATRRGKVVCGFVCAPDALRASLLRSNLPNWLPFKPALTSHLLRCVFLTTIPLLLLARNPRPDATDISQLGHCPVP